MLWGIMGTALLAFRTTLWFWYEGSPPSTMEDAPPLTVIIPAYNEGAMVLQSIESVANAHYPHERLQLLVVDDGSTDDTWTYIRQAAARYPELVEAKRLPKNAGSVRRSPKVSGTLVVTWSYRLIPTASSNPVRSLPWRGRFEIPEWVPLQAR